MKGKNYSYSDAKGLEVNITPHMLHQIKEIDKQYLVGILKDQEFSREHPNSWIGKCPFCSSTKKRNSQVPYQPAYLNPNNMGYVFYCCSCMTSTTAYKLILAVKGHSVAEEYLEARWGANQLAGGGFNCPLPQSVRERFLSEKEQRKAAHNNEYKLRKARNYIAKYGGLPNGQSFPKLNLSDEERRSTGLADMSSDCLPAKLERLLIPIEWNIGLRCQWVGELIAALAVTNLPIEETI